MSTQIPDNPAVVENHRYGHVMVRTPSKQRPPQGAHLYKLRIAAGLTLVQLAELIGETHSNIAFWEKIDKPPRSDVLAPLAAALGVSVEDLLTPNNQVQKPRGGPVGKLRRAFEDASELPRSQQEKIVEMVNAVVRGMRSQQQR